MDFLTANVKTLYQKFLAASICSALVMSIYSFVDTIAVGQSEGPLGTAAIAVITPLYGIMVFLAVLVGIGGSVLLGISKGEGDEKKGNAYFTAAVILMTVLTLAAWIIFIMFHNEIFTFFGADDSLMPKVMEYAKWIIWFFPAFIVPGFLGAFLRNDNAPALAMGAVIAGGIVNIFLDWFLVFPVGLGMQGAALATVIGTCIQALIMCFHFFRKKCRLKLVKPQKPGSMFRDIFSVGFGASILELGTVILVVIMNNQIMHYGGTTELAVYGMLATITTLFQALFGGVGQAIQPLVSANYGAGNKERFRSFRTLSLKTVILMGCVFTVIGELMPTALVKLFVDATADVTAAAPGILRIYFLLFLPMGITVLSTYYLQSIMRDKVSMVLAFLRSVAVSGMMLFLLPLFWGINGVWMALPIAELIVAGIAVGFINR